MSFYLSDKDYKEMIGIISGNTSGKKGNDTGGAYIDMPSASTEPKQQGIVADTVDAVQMGAWKGVSDIAHGLGALTGADWLHKVGDWAGEGADENLATMSDEMKVALNQNAFDGEDQGIRNVRWWAGNLGSLIGQNLDTVLTLGAGKAATFGVKQAGKMLLKKEAAEEVGKVAVEQAAKRGIPQKYWNMVGITATMSAMSGGSRYSQKRDDVMAMTNEQLSQIPQFSDAYYEIADSEEGKGKTVEQLYDLAKASFADKVGRDAALNPAAIATDLATNAVSGLGGGFWGLGSPAKTIKGGFLKGAMVEGGTEAIQGVAEQHALNKAEQDNYNPNKDLTDGMADNAINGAVLGGVFGSAMGGLDTYTDRRAFNNQKRTLLNHINTGNEAIDSQLKNYVDMLNQGAADLGDLVSASRVQALNNAGIANARVRQMEEDTRAQQQTNAQFESDFFGEEQVTQPNQPEFTIDPQMERAVYVAKAIEKFRKGDLSGANEFISEPMVFTDNATKSQFVIDRGFGELKNIAEAYGLDPKDGHAMRQWIEDYIAKAREYNANSTATSQTINSNHQSNLQPSPPSGNTNEQITQDDLTNATRYSFAGENAKTANTTFLEKAKQALESGIDADTVYNQTGWYKGVDGKFKFEIDNSNAQYIPGDDSVGAGRALGETLKNDDLYEAYPELRNLRVTFANLKDGLGSYSRDEGGAQITLNAALPDSEKKAILLHEVQHAIQDIEGFARGSSPTTEAMLLFKDKHGMSYQEAGELLSSKRAALQRAAFRHSYIQSEPNYKGKKADLTASTKEQIALQDEIRKLEGLLLVDMAEAYDLYNRSAGEVEARNVERRINMSQHDRSANRPPSTADILETDQVVRYDNNGVFRLDESANSDFSKAVDDVVSGNVAQGRISMGTTPDVLKMLGLPDSKIRITGAVIQKVMGEYLGIDKGDHSHIHNLTPETLKQIPKQMNNPVAVFKSSTRKDSYVILTELNETDSKTGKNKPVVSALHINFGKGNVEVIDVRSVYGRFDSQLTKAFRDDLLYLNKTKGQQFLKTHPLQLHWDLTSDANLSMRDIKTEADLSQYQSAKNNQESSANQEIQRAQAIINKTFGKAAQHIEVTTFANPPKDVKNLITSDVEGWFNPKTGKITIVADSIKPTKTMTKDERLQFVAWHEMAHRGINVGYKGTYDNLMQEVGKNKAVSQIADAIQAQRKNTDDLAATNRTVAIEEAIAEIMAANETGKWNELETRYGVEIKKGQRQSSKSWLAMTAQRIKEFLAKIFGAERAAQFSDEDVLNLVANIKKNAVGNFNENDNVRFSRNEELTEERYNQAKENGETELTFHQWQQVRSPEFKAWFGDWENDPENASKVVNPKTGEPLVVYHGVIGSIERVDRNRELTRDEMAEYRRLKQEIWNDYSEKYKAVEARYPSSNEIQDMAKNGRREEAIEIHNKKIAETTVLVDERVEKERIVNEKFGQGIPLEDKHIHFELENNAFDIDRSRDIGTHFSESYSTAKSFADRIGKDKGTVFPVFLNVRELHKVHDIFSRYQGLESALNAIHNRGIITDAQYNSLIDRAIRADNNDKVDERYWGELRDVESFWSKLNAILQKKRNLGFVYRNEVEGGGKSYAVFKSNQIKSATDNTGAFSKDSDDIRFSRANTVQSALDLSQTGKAESEPSLLGDLKSKDLSGFKERFNRAMGKVDEWLADSLRPVNDWIDSMHLADQTGNTSSRDHEKRRLKDAMYTAKGKRDAMNSELEQAYLKPILSKIAALSKATKKGKNPIDELTMKRMVGNWISARYSIEKNMDLLRADEKAMRDTKRLLDSAKQNGSIAEINRLSNAYAKAKEQYENRKADIYNTDYKNKGNRFKVGVAGGWSIPEAELILKNTEQHISKSDLESVAEMVYDLNQARLEIDRASGRYTEKEYQEYKANRHYVPLTGDPNADVDTDIISGAGSSAVNIGRDKALKGRTSSEAEDAIDAMWKSVGKSTTYAGFAEFKGKIDDLYETEVTMLKEKGYSDSQAREQATANLGISKRKMQGLTRSSDNVLIRKERGEYYEYELPSQAMEALRNDNVEHANAFLKLISKPTGWYARGVTQWTVTFAPMNMMRDTWEKSEFIRVQKLYDKNNRLVDSKTMDKIGRATIANAFTDKEVWQATKRLGFGQELRDSVPAERMLKQLLKEGGVSNYGTYLDKSEVDLIKRLKKENNPIAGKLEKAGKILEGYNKMFDTVSALAAYKALVENGIDSKQAAATTLELTNFRKTGSKMRGIKALYMFSQPTVMGAANLIRYLSTRKGQVRFVAYLAGMTALYTVLRSMDDDDEGGNKMDQLGDITRYIPIPIGGGHYFKIPVGFGMPQMAWNFSTNIVKGAVSDISLTEAGANMLAHSLKTFAPVSPSEISASKYPMEKITLTATPTILQPLMQNVLNRSAFGNKITTNFVRDDKLKAEQSKATTAQFWKDVALDLNDTLGIDMHPEQIKNLFDGYSSAFGSLRELNTLFVENPNREQLGRNTRMPFVNQFIGTTNEFSIQSRYYEASEEARKVATEYESRKNRGALDGWLDDDKRKLIRFYEQDKSTTQTMRSEKAKLTRALRSGQISAVAYENGIKRYNKDMSRTQAQILRKYRLMEGLNTN